MAKKKTSVSKSQASQNASPPPSSVKETVVTKAAKKPSMEDPVARLLNVKCQPVVEEYQRIGLEKVTPANFGAYKKRVNDLKASMATYCAEMKREAPKCSFKGSLVNLKKQLADLEASGDEAAAEMAREISEVTLPALHHRVLMEKKVKSLHNLCNKLDDKLKKEEMNVTQLKAENSLLSQAQQVLKIKESKGSLPEGVKSADDILKKKLMTSTELKDLSFTTLMQLNGPLNLTRVTSEKFQVICHKGSQTNEAGVPRTAVVTGLKDDVLTACSHLRALSVGTTKVHDFGHPNDARKVQQDLSAGLSSKGVYMAAAGTPSGPRTKVLFAGPSVAAVDGAIADAVNMVQEEAEKRKAAKEARSEKLKLKKDEAAGFVPPERDIRNSDLIVPGDKARLIVGEKGATIKKFEGDFKVTIKIRDEAMPKENRGALRGHGPKIVEISGKKPAVMEAKASLEKFVKDIMTADIKADEELLKKLFQGVSATSDGHFIRQIADLTRDYAIQIAQIREKGLIKILVAPREGQRVILEEAERQVKELVEAAKKDGEEKVFDLAQMGGIREQRQFADGSALKSLIQTLQTEGARLFTHFPAPAKGGKGQGRRPSRSGVYISVHGPEEVTEKALVALKECMEKVVADEKAKNHTQIIKVTDEKLFSLVIGKGGSTVRRLQQDSGARISAENEKGQIVVSGNPASVARGVRMVQEIITPKKEDTAKQGKGKGKGTGKGRDVESASGRSNLLGSHRTGWASGKKVVAQPKKFDLEAMSDDEFPQLGASSAKPKSREAPSHPSPEKSANASPPPPPHAPALPEETETETPPQRSPAAKIQAEKNTEHWDEWRAKHNDQMKALNESNGFLPESCQWTEEKRAAVKANLAEQDAK